MDTFELALSPFRSPGGKSRIAGKIVSFFPVHDTYIEPFAGAAHCFFAKTPARFEVLNDKDPEIAFALKFIRDLTNEKFERLLSMPRKGTDRETLAMAKNLKPKDDVERFWKFRYLNAFSYGGSMTRFGKVGPTFSLSYSTIWKCKERLKNALILNLDYREAINRFRNRSKTLVYLDPPFYESDSAFPVKFKLEDWQELAKFLSQANFHWLLSCSLRARHLFPGFHQRRILNEISFAASRYFQKYQLLVSNFSLDGSKQFQLSWAPIFPSEEPPLGRRIYLHEILRHFDNSGFKFIHPGIYLCGSICNQGYTDKDIDIIVNLPYELPFKIKVPIDFRLYRMLPHEYWPRVCIRWGDYIPSFTNHVPLYDLAFVRDAEKPFEIIEMQ